jgi:thiol-disulfide isomerase/thioredoxin
MEKGYLSTRALVVSFVMVFALTCFAPSIALSGAPVEGQPAPDFVLPGLLDAQTQSLKDLQGKVVLLNIWASWCSGCREEMADLMSVQEHYGPRGFAIVTVNIDNSASRAVGFIKSLEERSKKKTGLILLFDKDKAVSKDYRQRAMPTSYLIDRQGILKKIYPGSFTKDTIGALKTAIDEVLK